MRCGQRIGRTLRRCSARATTLALAANALTLTATTLTFAALTLATATVAIATVAIATLAKPSEGITATTLAAANTPEECGAHANGER